MLDAVNLASIATSVAYAETNRIDGLVNSAAIVVHVDPLETKWTDWKRIFRVNLFGV